MSDFKRMPGLDDPYEWITKRPWELAVEPFRVAPHVWYIAGQTMVGAYIIDTGAGLILIDTGEYPTLYMLTESIHKLGYSPAEIKMILISHGHGDHCGAAGALKEMTKAPIYMSTEDNQVRIEDPIRVFIREPYQDFVPDRFYDDDKPISLGNITIRTRLCPGHTPGTTTFFFDDAGEDGNVYHCAMHGGIGHAFLANKFLDMYQYPRSFRERFIDDCFEMAKMDIDITIASHIHHMNYLSGVNEADRSDFSGFAGKDIWTNFLEDRAQCAIEVARKDGDDIWIAE